MEAQDLRRHKTDGHLDIDAVRPGAILVAPVKVPGGGVYLGDMHAGQGDGFLKSLPGGLIEAPFDLGFVADTRDGVRFSLSDL